MNKYLKFIKKQKMPELQFEDKKMPMTEVNKQSNSLRFTHSGEGNEVSAARTSEPLPSDAAAVYFEAYVRSISSRYEVGVGIIQKDCALKRHPGESNLSIGYISSGELLINGKKAKTIQPYRSKSTVGIGVIYSRQQVFITLDGTLLETIPFEHNPTTWPKFYPCVSQRSHGDAIELRFTNFAFDFEQLRTKVENQCIEQIEQQSLDGINFYTLVGDYLKFHGYNKTYDELKKASHFTEVASFVEHPYWQGKIKFKEQSAMSEQHPKEGAGLQENHTKVAADEEMQDQLVVARKFSTRQRIMSDYWADILPQDGSRKKSHDGERMLLQSRRKSSVISNISNEEAGKLEKRIKDAPGMQIIDEAHHDTERERFLLRTRIEVLKMIREERIEEAQAELERSLPQLFQIADYLHAYFDMHIYLRALKNEGAAKAMMFMRASAEKFKKFKEELYPAYTRQGSRLKFVPFSYLMSLISLKPGTDNDALSGSQFYAFSNYINELILKNLGLYSESRLDILVNHLRCIHTKNEQYQINGLTFVCDI